MKNRRWLIAALLVPLAGCATNEIAAPRAEIGQAEATIARAAESEATQYAPLALREARRKADLARAAIDAEEFTRARFLAREARASAELAIAQAETQRTEELAQAALEGVNTLRQELNLKEGTQ